MAKTVPAVLTCLLVMTALGQWSEPALVWQDTTWASESRLLCAPGDTLRAAVVDRGGAGWPGWHRIQTAWSADGDSWSDLIDVTGRDSLCDGWYGGLGFGCDPQSRLWLGWYRGNGYTFGEDSWAICTVMRDSGGWHPFAKSIDSFWGGGAESFAADRQGNWYMSVVACALDVPGVIESATYSRLDGDSWTFPATIAAGQGSPISSGHYSMVLVQHPDSGLWEVNDWSAYMASPRVYVHRVFRDTTVCVLYLPGEASEATADSLGRLWVVYVRDGMLRSAVVDGAIVDSAVVTDDLLHGGPVCTGPDGRVWAAWKNQNSVPAVSYNSGGGWSEPEVVTDSVGGPTGMVAGSDGRAYLLMWLRMHGEWGLYSSYRLTLPGVEVPPAASRAWPDDGPTIARGVLRAGDSRQKTGGRAELLDAVGRKVLELLPGDNDVRQLSPGVYFVRGEEAWDRVVRRVIITR